MPYLPGTHHFVLFSLLCQEIEERRISKCAVLFPLLETWEALKV